MFSVFPMGSAASGRGLCDIDRVFFRVSKSRFKKLGSPSTTKIYMYVPIMIQTKKPKSLVYFRRARTSQFFET